ncbi:MAG: hypothetical protein M3Y48_04140 [Actinomycetota bacterium]|nr:hypothetical protein [Actinomycetota bacterium]
MVAYAVFVYVLIGSATYVALRCTDSDRRKDAYRVLALLMTLATGTTGIAAIIKLLIGLGLIS